MWSWQRIHFKQTVGGFFSKLQHCWFLSIWTLDKGDRVIRKRTYWVQTISPFLTQRQSLLLCWKGLLAKQSSLYYILAIWIILLYAAVFSSDHCWGLNWSFWTIFLQNENLVYISEEGVGQVSALKYFPGWSVFQNWGAPLNSGKVDPHCFPVCCIFIWS